jgi:hypothetical protein
VVRREERALTHSLTLFSLSLSHFRHTQGSMAGWMSMPMNGLSGDASSERYQHKKVLREGFVSASKVRLSPSNSGSKQLRNFFIQ